MRFTAWLAVSGESHVAGWFGAGEITGSDMHHAQRLRVEHAFKEGAAHAG